MHVPRNKWTDGEWNKHLHLFRTLARWFGVDDANPSMDRLQVLYKIVSAKVFAESVPDVMAATGMKEYQLKRELGRLWSTLGLGYALPPWSLKYGRLQPTRMRGVALLAGGTISWMWLRWMRTRLVEYSGARFERIIVLGSSRLCNSAQDWRQPYIRDVATKGREPTELEVWRQWISPTGQLDRQYVFPDLPLEVGDEEWLKAFPEPDEGRAGKPLSLEQQLQYLVATGQYADLVGDKPVFMAVNGGNALYAPLHVRRVLGLDDIWFSQPATNVVTPVPDDWWPEDQDLMTTPSGIIRLWIELRANGCINDDAKP